MLKRYESSWKKRKRIKKVKIGCNFASHFFAWLLPLDVAILAGTALSTKGACYNSLFVEEVLPCRRLRIMTMGSFAPNVIL
jgi:hypothetical protein